MGRTRLERRLRSEPGSADHDGLTWARLLGLPCLVWLDGTRRDRTRRGRITRRGCVAMAPSARARACRLDSDLVRKCPVSVTTMRLNAEICNGHGTFPDKFSISDAPFPAALSRPRFPASAFPPVLSRPPFPAALSRPALSD